MGFFVQSPHGGEREDRAPPANTSPPFCRLCCGFIGNFRTARVAREREMCAGRWEQLCRPGSARRVERSTRRQFATQYNCRSVRTNNRPWLMAGVLNVASFNSLVARTSSLG